MTILSKLYFKICRQLIKWVLFKPLYRIESLLACGWFYMPKNYYPNNYKYQWKWLCNLNYKLAKLSIFYGL